MSEMTAELARATAFGQTLTGGTQPAFYDRYHMYLHLLCRDALGWGLRDKHFPDLQEITDFTVAIRNDTPLKS